MTGRVLDWHIIRSGFAGRGIAAGWGLNFEERSLNTEMRYSAHSVMAAMSFLLYIYIVKIIANYNIPRT